jgi:hypothetical protein
MNILAWLILATLAFAVNLAQAKVVDVVEFYNAAQDHYFITSLPEEIAKLDSGSTWKRTGQHFQAHDTQVNGTNPVCRYYMPPGYGDSHFFSASPAECARVRNLYPHFIRESDAAMHIAVPSASSGECKTDHQPVYRVWNRRADSNHRYTTDSATRDAMIAQGWQSEGYGPNGVAMCAPLSLAEDAVTASLPPPCKGNDSRVAFPDGPHGMYVWAPGPALMTYLQQDVIGKDPTLCGASLVIMWSSVETANGVYNWDAVTTAAQPFTDAGLTVNLLFSEATEGAVNNVTPAWVTQPTSEGGAGAPAISCPGQPTIPVYMSPEYEAAWTTFIAAAVKQFSYGNSTLAPHVGYMRFATGGGAEALLPPGLRDGGDCQTLWDNPPASWTYDAWNAHEARIITAIGSQPTDKQLMVSLGQAPGGPNIYDVSNKAAAVAVPLKVGFSFENLGMGNVAAPGTTPGPCSPDATIADLHWCQAYTTYVGQVPFAMQPITATNNTSQATMDITNLLQYALDNNIQVFELYGEEWLQADSPTWPSFVQANQAKYQAALQSASQTLGATNGQ